MAKGRKAQAAAAAKAAQAAQLTTTPPRRVLPDVRRDSLNGAKAKDLFVFKIGERGLADSEVEAWDRCSAKSIPAACCGRAGGYQGTAAMLLMSFVKELPAVLTFLPYEPGSKWAECTAWIATTKAPNYDIEEGPIREIDPEFMAEGETPLLAALALLEDRLKRKIWADNGGSYSPRVLHYATVYPHLARGQ